MIPFFFPNVYNFTLLILLSCTSTTPSDISEFDELESLRKSPEQTEIICSKTTSRVLLEQCKKMKKRPHLYEKNTKDKHRNYDSPFQSTPSSSSTCTENIVQCRTNNAKKAQTQKERVAECNALTTIWKSECLFETAEESLKRKSITYADAAELCTLSGSLIHKCLQHLSIVYAEHFRNINASLSGSKHINDFWKSRDIGQSRKMKSIYWMIFLEIYLNEKNTLDNSIFKKIPTENHPFVWAAITNKIVRDSQRKISLQDRTSSLKDFYHGRKNLRFTIKKPSKRQMKHRVFIPTNLPDVQTVPYLDDQNRILGSTIEEEIQICLLLSAQYLGKHKHLIKQGTESPSKIVAVLAKKLR